MELVAWQPVILDNAHQAVTMSVSYAANKLRVPPGFEHLLEGLAREILREQPKDLVKYAAEYFRKKLQERDGIHHVCIHI